MKVHSRHIVAVENTGTYVELRIREPGHRKPSQIQALLSEQQDGKKPESLFPFVVKFIAERRRKGREPLFRDCPVEIETVANYRSQLHGIELIADCLAATGCAL